MASFLKAVKRSPSGLFGKLRHKKLPEEWGDGIKEPVVEGMRFYVKYLGSTLVEDPSGEQSTADAIKTIIAMAKASGKKKLQRVTIVVSPTGITTTDVATGEVHLDVSIYRISYCSADATYDRVVAFIATNKNETLECHAFLTSRRKVAQAIALTISQAFNIAFDIWKQTKAEKSDNQMESTTASNGSTGDTKDNSETDTSSKAADSQVTLIDLSSDENSSNAKTTHMGFDDNFDDTFIRLAAQGSHPMLLSNVAINDLQDLTQFVQSEAKASDKDQFFQDTTDDLLSL